MALVGILRERRSGFAHKGACSFLSLYEADTHKPTKKMLYDRCHEMIDLVCEELG